MCSMVLFMSPKYVSVCVCETDGVSVCERYDEGMNVCKNTGFLRTFFKFFFFFKEKTKQQMPDQYIISCVMLFVNMTEEYSCKRQSCPQK